MQIKPADLTTSLKGKDDDYIKKIIKGGGEVVGKSPSMPANSDLTDSQLNSLVEYIKHL